LNPSVGSNFLLQIYEALTETEQKMPLYEELARKYPKDFSYQGNLIKNTYRYETLTTQWYLALGYLIASAIFYLSLYLFFERDRDVDKKKRTVEYEELRRDDDRETGISMCVMSDSPLMKDLENPSLKKKDINSALYKEEFAKENTSNVNEFYRGVIYYC